MIGPDAAGLGAVAIAAFLLADLACASLLTDALVQRASLSEHHVRSALTVQVLVGAGGALALALLAPVIAHAADAPEVRPLILALAALLPFSAFSGASAGLVLRDQRYRLLALRALLGQPLALAAGLLLAVGGYGCQRHRKLGAPRRSKIGARRRASGDLGPAATGPRAGAYRLPSRQPAGAVCSAPGGSSRRSSPGCGRGG